MKIIITGTTSGLGLTCKNYFSNYNVVELNRPTYDLDKNLEDFVFNDFDVYINNAYSNWTQIDLLYKLFEKNKDRSCKIINVGSVCSDRTYDKVYPYAIHKLALDAACNQLQQIDSKCKIVHLKLGRMRTPMTAHRPEPKIDTAIIAKQIDYIIKMDNSVVIKELSIDNFFS
jgi:NADP-dependent 3-hydroxy acid dehydrogenase YdfG